MSSPGCHPRSAGVDRQKLLCFINVGLAATAVGLAVLGWLHLLNPCLMGAGSVVGAVFILPWLRGRFSSDCLSFLANLLLVLVYVLMGFVRQTEWFFVVAALAGVGWTMSASELWVASQRAVPGWARGCMNAMAIMISQGAMAIGGVIWGSASSIAGANYTLLAAAILSNSLGKTIWP